MKNYLFLMAFMVFTVTLSIGSCTQKNSEPSPMSAIIDISNDGLPANFDWNNAVNIYSFSQFIPTALDSVPHAKFHAKFTKADSNSLSILLYSEGSKDTLKLKTYGLEDLGNNTIGALLKPVEYTYKSGAVLSINSGYRFNLADPLSRNLKYNKNSKSYSLQYTGYYTCRIGAQRGTVKMQFITNS